MSQPRRAWLRPLRLLPLLLLGAGAAPPKPGPGRQEAVVASIVAYSLQNYHYSKQGLDDQMAVRWMDNYLESLDPSRIFFTAADIADFSRFQTRLDDAVRAIPADLDPAFTVHGRYAQRMREYCAFAKAALRQPGVLESRSADLVADRSKAPWPADEAELHALWRDRVTEQWLRLALQGVAKDQAITQLDARFDRLLRDLDETESTDVLELYLGALGQAYDPHSVWFAPASKDDFDIQMRDALEGIGATLVREEDYITVKSLVPGGPAARANELQPGDRIVAVSQGGQKTDVVGMRIDHVVKLIRGPKGTDVVLTVIPAGAADASQTRDLRITRDQVVIAEAAAKGEVREVDGVKVGVIDVPSFYQDLSERGGKSAPRTTADDVRRILDGFKKDGVAAVLVDLRANGGGALTQAIALTGLFIDAGPVVQIKDRQGRVEVLEDREKGLAWEGPLAVVTSAHSASASEIFAGAIQDYGRGLVVGDSSTHGKGTVQQFIDLSPVVAGFQVPGAADVAGALKYTTDQFYRVSGRSTQQVGVEADVVIPSLSDGLDMGESSLPFALAYDEIDPARFRAWGQRPDRAALQRRSAERVGGDPRFQVMAELRALRDARDQDTISLDLDQRRQERSNWEELEKRAEAVGLEGEAVDPVLDEALRVVRDFVKG